MKFKSDYLGLDVAIQNGVQDFENNGYSIKEIITWAYCQGIVDKEAASVSQMKGEEYVIDLLDITNSKYLVANIITEKEWMGE